MKNILAFLVVSLLCSCAHTVSDSGDKLVHPLDNKSRAVLQQRISALQPGMTVKQVLRKVGLAGCPTPAWPVPGNNSTVTQLGNGFSLHLRFADGSDGGGFVSAEIREDSANQEVEAILR